MLHYEGVPRGEGSEEKIRSRGAQYVGAAPHHEGFEGYGDAEDSPPYSYG